MEKSIQIIGTSHIAKKSMEEVRSKIKQEKPEIVAVELDRNRLAGLLSKEKSKLRFRDIKSIGLTGFLFTALGGWLQKKLGNVVGIDPGSDMLAAVETAQKEGSEVILIDQDIRITLNRFSKCFGIRDLLNILTDTIKGIFVRDKRISFDLRTVPDDKVIEHVINLVKTRYPGIYKPLIEERNIIMVKNLIRIQNENPDKKIIAVVGAGHKKEMDIMLSEQLKNKVHKISPTSSKGEYSITYSV